MKDSEARGLLKKPCDRFSSAVGSGPDRGLQGGTHVEDRSLTGRPRPWSIGLYRYRLARPPRTLHDYVDEYLRRPRLPFDGV